MNRKFKLLISIFCLLLLIFKIFPKIGLYTTLFDRGDYSNETPDPTNIISSLDELTPATKKRAMKFLEECDSRGLDVIITETYRTQNRQDYLYAQGRERDGMVVTWTKHSRHTDRYAFDICKNGADPYGDEEFFRRCAEVGREVGLNPGYYWEECQDMPHYQYDTWWNR